MMNHSEQYTDGYGEFHDFTAKGPGSIPGRATKIPQAVQCNQKRKKEESYASHHQIGPVVF